MIQSRVLETKTNAWNGYHSCPLAMEDRDYTTFVTEEGRFRYCITLQGFVASSDDYILSRRLEGDTGRHPASQKIGAVQKI